MPRREGKRDSCSQETSVLVLTLGFGLRVTTFSPVPMILREFEQRKKLEYLVNEDFQFYSVEDYGWGPQLVEHFQISVV